MYCNRCFNLIFSTCGIFVGCKMNVVKGFFCDLFSDQIVRLTVHKNVSDIAMFLIHASLFILCIAFMLLKCSSWSDSKDNMFKFFCSCIRAGIGVIWFTSRFWYILLSIFIVVLSNLTINVPFSKFNRLRLI